MLASLVRGGLLGLGRSYCLVDPCFECVESRHCERRRPVSGRGRQVERSAIQSRPGNAGWRPRGVRAGGAYSNASDQCRRSDGERPMQFTVKGKNVDVPEKLRAHAEHKLAKVQRFDDRILAIDVEFSEERNPRVPQAHTVQVTVTTKSRLVRAHASAVGSTGPSTPRASRP